MHQVKLFKNVESEIREFEREINGWMQDLQENGGHIVQIQGTISPQTIGNPGSPTSRFSPSDLFVIVTYETK